MLDLFRKKSQSPFLQAIVIIIALVFVFLGVGSYQDGGRNEAALVNGDVITLDQFRSAYEREYENFKQQYGQDVPKQLIEDGSFKNRVLNKMVMRLLLMQGARDIGIIVTDAELQAKIQAMPFLRSDGIFDRSRYRNVLASMRKSPADFEASVRNDMLVDKAVARINAFSEVTTKEIQDRYLYASSEIKLEYVSFRANTYKEKVEVTDEALAAFFEERKEDYKTDRQVKARYLFFNFADLAKNVSLTDEDVLKNYEKNRAEYDIPEKRRARHILIKTDNVTPGQKAEKRKIIEDLLAKVKKGEDFAALAKEYSEDNSAKKGGDLGLFSRGRMVKPFEEAAFALEVGGVSDVVETSFGFHIIKVEEIQPAHLKELAEVRDDIEKGLKNKLGKSQAFTQANQAYKDIIAAGSIDQYAVKSGVEIAETDFFTKRDPAGSFQKRGKLLRALLGLKKGELSSIVEGGKEYAILFLVDEKKPAVPELAVVRERVEKDFISYSTRKKALEDSEEMLASLQAGGITMEAEAEKYSLKVDETEFYSRRDKWPAKYPKEFSTAAYSLTPANPYPGNVAKQFNVFYVYGLKEHKEPALSMLFEGKMQAVKESILPEKRQAVLDAWLNNLKAKAEITFSSNL